LEVYGGLADEYDEADSAQLWVRMGIADGTENTVGKASTPS
jgi:hypothetical protein